MLKTRTPQDLGFAKAQLSDVGRGLLKPPVTSVYLQAQEGDNIPLNQLPPTELTERLLKAYFECVHRRFPIIYWPDFHQECAKVCGRRTTAGVARENVALVFAVLACGSLHLQPPAYIEIGQRLLSEAISLINMWEDDVAIVQSQIVFLASIFLAEVNRKTASWIWLGSAIRIAQDLGLHIQGGQWSHVEGELRKRIWYSYYCWDR